MLKNGILAANQDIGASDREDLGLYELVGISYQLQRIREVLLKLRIHTAGFNSKVEVDLMITLDQFLSLVRALELSLIGSEAYELALCQDLLLSQGIGQVNKFLNLNF